MAEPSGNLFRNSNCLLSKWYLPSLILHTNGDSFELLCEAVSVLFNSSRLLLLSIMLNESSGVCKVKECSTAPRLAEQKRLNQFPYLAAQFVADHFLFDE